MFFDGLNEERNKQTNRREVRSRWEHGQLVGQRNVGEIQREDGMFEESVRQLRDSRRHRKL